MLRPTSQAMDGTFGVGYSLVRTKYFPEYNRELYGKHSPGPGKYEIATRDFSVPKNSFKSMPRVTTCLISY